MKLTIKQENFCNYFVECGNASEAYRRAYSCEKMKDATIHRKAFELLENGKITARVRELQEELQQRSNITKDDAVRELTNIIRARVTDVLKIDDQVVTIKDIQSLPDDIVTSISSVKNTPTGVEVRFYDKLNALDRLAKMMGWDSPKEMKIDFNNLTDEEIDTIINKIEL